MVNMYFTVTLTEVVMFTFTISANDSDGVCSSIQPQVCLLPVILML